MISRHVLSAAVLAASTFAVAPSFADIIANGSFEANTGKYLCPTSWNCANSTYGVGPASLFSAISTGGSNLTSSPDGGNMFSAWALNKTTYLYQYMTGLTIGETYDVSFEYAAAYRGPGPAYAGSVGWTVYTGNTSQTSYVSTPAPGTATGWLNGAYSFVATQATQMLYFATTATVAVAPEPALFLDGVSVVAHNDTPPPVSAVPEPSTWALTLAGLAAIGAIARRRQPKNGQDA